MSVSGRMASVAFHNFNQYRETGKVKLFGGYDGYADGTQSRDFIYVHDTVDAVVKLHDVLPAGETVNISTDNQTTINELIPRICAHYGYTGEILRKPARHSDVLSHNASNEKVKGLIQYRLTPFEQGLAETLDWYTHLIGNRA